MTEMGLDIVALVLELEKEFEVSLSDAELASTETVGALYALLQVRRDLVADSQAVQWKGADWERYIDLVERETGVKRSRLVPEARFIRDLGLG